MKKLFYFFAVLAITLVSCNMNENFVVDEPPTITDPEELYAKTEYNFDMRDFAMAVNDAINSNKSFRKLVKEEALVQFDGDYNFLLSHVAEKEVSHNDVDNGIDTPNKAKSNFRVRDMLEDAFYTLNEKNELRGARAKRMISKVNGLQNSSASQTIIDELMEKYPLLQIAVPVHIEDLEDENYIPPVTFIPEECDEQNTEYLLGFKQDGIIAIDAITEPDNAVIVIGINERIPMREEVGGGSDVTPPTPSGLTVRVIESGILLNWNMPAGTDLANTLGYKVYRKKGLETDFSLFASVQGYANRSFIDQDVTNNVTFQYYVVAYNNYNLSGESNYETITPARPNAASTFVVEQEALNRVNLRWTFASNEYNGDVKIYKRNMGYGGSTSYGGPIVTLPASADYYFDTDITPGQKTEYLLERVTATGTSIPAYDFIYTPYRDMSTDSKVRIAKIKFSNISKIESWWAGKPEFRVKVLTVNGDKTTVIEPGLYIEMNTRTNDKWSTVSLNQGRVPIDWKPNKANWFDGLSFYFAEEDDNCFLSWAKVTLFGTKMAKATEKDPASGAVVAAYLEAAQVIGEQLDRWIENEDEQIGYAYLYYYDYPKKEYQIHCQYGTLTIQFTDEY